MSNLKQRFERFMSGLDGAECIDDLLKQSDMPGRQRADYLAFNRNVIIEQKSLEIDLDAKIQPLVIDFFNTRGIVHPDKISFRSFVETISRYADTGGLKQRLLQMVTRNIDDILAKADKQTRDTRELFGIPKAVGIVVILNDNVQLIEPDFVAEKAFTMLRKLSTTGETLRYPNNHVVISISEAHRLPSKNAEKIPTETLFSDAANQRRLCTLYSNILMRRWAAFNGASYIKSAERTGELSTRDPQKLFLTK
jgi:hypothetical protein